MEIGYFLEPINLLRDRWVVLTKKTICRKSGDCCPVVLHVQYIQCMHVALVPTQTSLL